MTAVVEDRRVRKTKAALQQAMIELVIEQGYEAISIDAIASRADVTRATFYAHYPSKAALLTAVVDAFADDVIAALGEVRLRALRVPPAGPGHLPPPWRPGHRPGGGDLGGQQPGEDVGPAEALGRQLEAQEVVDQPQVAAARSVDRAEDDVVPVLLEHHHGPGSVLACCHAP